MHQKRCGGFRVDRSKNVEKFRFEWGYVTHPGIWACGGGRQDLPPVLVGITHQVPQKEPEYAWWCYLWPLPEFENELTPCREDGGMYISQCEAVPTRITKNMVAWGTAEQFIWHPIETAPLDGEKVLLSSSFKVGESSWGICRMQRDGYVANDGHPCWRAEDQTKCFPGDITHWMPMPKPPQKKAN